MAKSTEIFSKSLKDTDIKKRLAIPARILSSLPDFNGSHAVKIHLMYGTKMWPIVCSIRKTGYKKPVFAGGWVDFVRCNKFNVGDELTLYKVQDEAGSFCYRVQVEKPAARSLVHSHEVDQTVGTNRKKACNFKNKQGQLLKREEAITKLVEVASNAPVAFVSHVTTTKPSIRIFGTIVSHEKTSKADQFKAEEVSKTKLFGKTKGEPPFHSFNISNEEREIKSFGLNEGVAIAYGTSTQSVGDAYYRSLTGGLSSDLILAPPVLDLDLTLAPPVLYMKDTVCSLQTN
ncbi:hypothetical protein PTKIN_Ptkin10aG0188100 [Pterospermum kingtungense]